MFSQSTPASRFRRPLRSAFTLLEVLLVLGIIGLFIICVIGYFASRGVEPLKPPPRKPAVEKTTPLPATPDAVQAPPAAPAPANPAPAAPAEPAP